MRLASPFRSSTAAVAALVIGAAAWSGVVAQAAEEEANHPPAATAPVASADEDQITGEPSASPTPALDPQAIVRSDVRDKLEAQFHLAERAINQGNLDDAERAFARLLALPAPDADKRAALFRMADLYKKRAALPKAAAVYEKILALYPNDPDAANTYLELGRLYRQAGLYDLAINRLYSVLNSALSISEKDTNADTVRDRRKLSLLARFEIAEASYAKGDYTAATKFYSRLELLGLSPNDRPVVAFKNAQSLFKLEDYAAAVAASRAYLEEFGSTPRAPEARNLLARSLQKLNKPQEAIDAVLDLLRTEKKAGDAGNLARWQKETGKQVAAQFYESGDFRSALTVYQTLATLDKNPEWQWPIVYQIGLCFERMHLPDRAKEAYGYLLRNPQDTNGQGKVSGTLESVRQMAQWRQEHLNWQQGSETQLQALLGPLKDAPDNNNNPMPNAGGSTAPPTPAKGAPVKASAAAPATPEATPPPLQSNPAEKSAAPAKRTQP